MLPNTLDHRSLRTTSPVEVRRSLFSLTSLRDEVRRIEQDLAHLSHQVEEKARHFRQLSTNLAMLRENARKLLQDFVKSNEGQEDTQTLENIRETSTWQAARSIVAEIQYRNSDMQTLPGQYAGLGADVVCRANSLVQVLLWHWLVSSVKSL